ncbi:GNAT family N-acetyltransferase [Sporosarcina pasteurii]|uniref:Acetyltransferase (GNAT) family n=1 Tax=Sporosarcina pasteurii TaxID=1474 RepID=A0A380CA67_SPOPA|nr:GNAT family N-acetyltransferase [Sporosarcina pasteurii]MDS9472652.1 GNAT family N-acetyltransferase [Sporosarcina pasteurii]QBQ04312.1 GNAT family N-acetyltransferase [Sporosarcina pasteurii]SUJ16170.1 Acetyltransferase (GNAT) family [Sporosarcina pasteurii]
MTNVKLDNNVQEIVVRNIVLEDLDEVAALSAKCFGPDMSLKHEHFVSQLELFPEGQICVEYKGEIVGTALSLIVNFEDYGEKHTYYEICDLGYIRNHNAKGRNLYGIEVGVNKQFRGMQLGRRLYEERKRICKDLNLENILIGGRMPFYYKYAEQMSAVKYAQEVIRGNIYDPVLTFQSKNGFKLNKVIANYLPGDEESLEYATLMEWENEEYRL